MTNPQQYLNNPNVRKMLDVIASAEGVKHGYNTIFGNERFGNLSSHPNVRKQFKQTDGKMNETTAAGRYQFLKPTWDDTSRRYGLKDFSPQSQDIAAIGLLMQNGALPYVLKGDYQTAVRKSGGTWASLPSSPYAQPKRSQAEIDKLLGGYSSQSQQSYEAQYVDLNALRKKQQPQQQYVDLNTLRGQLQQQQYVDLNALRQNTQSQYVDLNALRGQQQGVLTQD
ncbi:glycoside hydrolase family 104 protein [Acinetobacter sp. ANC 5378]|uniref:glycoside hydrolase family 24 protein n=1 Tax=Acinetobacter sp. ANC 5378 TaxID=2731249 RepID=UPI0014904588|nr:glycoside hydrolase family 104 protein [Acinetobacter sp. ANC 5378]NNG81009.1 glycoside hydrolase family 104 protein [Acinetobacter sp. ANC 5378]